MKPPNAAHLLKYFNTAQSDPVTLQSHLGWSDPDKTGSPADLGYGEAIVPAAPYYFGPAAPTEALMREIQPYGDRIRDMRLGYFRREIVAGKDGDNGVGGDRITRTNTGETYLAIRILDHLPNGIVRAIFLREAT